MVKLGLAEIEWLEENQPYFGKPMDDRDFEIEGTCDKFRVTTLDGLNQVFAVVKWQNFKPQVNWVITMAGQAKYRRLENAGRLGVFDNFEGDPKIWGFEVRAMKYGTTRDRPTLKQTTLAELDTLLEGQSTLDILTTNGALKVDKRSRLMANPANRPNELMVVCEAGNTRLVAIAFTISRVLATMKDLGG